jgi:hypothetical protein
MINKLDYPAAMGGVVTEGHAQYCRDNGHATHESDGVLSPLCPRCGNRINTMETIITTDTPAIHHIGEIIFECPAYAVMNRIRLVINGKTRSVRSGEIIVRRNRIREIVRK